MNNKGFGLPEMLVFVGVSLFILIVINIYINKNISNDKIISTSDNIENVNTTLVPSNVKIPEEYIKLENKIKEASKKYKINKNENIIISLNKLKKANLLVKLTDTKNSNICLNGYVIYNSDSKEYTPYINCPGMYVTNNYSSEFE